MLKSVFLLLLAFMVLTLVAPIVFVVKTIATAYNEAKVSGIKQAWESVAKYFYNIAVDGLDQLGATILYKTKDLTISSQTFILCKRGKCVGLKDLLIFSPPIA